MALVLGCCKTMNLTKNFFRWATRSTQNIWHSPATIVSPSWTWEVAQFGASTDGLFTTNTSAAVINQIGNRQQMVWFISFATSWSLTSNFLMHAHINWVTRGLCMYH
jgi:hypothetical protein